MAETKARKPPKKVGAVMQAFALLRALSNADEALGVTALARLAALNPSTAFNILRTLVAENAALFDERTKTYSLSPGLLDICGKLVTRSIAEAIRGELERIANDTNCLVGLWQASEGKMVLIERAVAKSPMRLDMQVHHKLPPFAGAIGRAYAAALGVSDARLRRGFLDSRWEGAIDADGYIEQVREAEKVGYAIDDGALHPGVVTVASVIRDAQGEVSYGLTASDIAHRLDRTRLVSLGEELRGLANKYSRI